MLDKVWAYKDGQHNTSGEEKPVFTGAASSNDKSANGKPLSSINASRVDIETHSALSQCYLYDVP